METSTKEIGLDESVAEVVRTLSAPVRQYLAQGKYAVFASRAMGKYKLSVQQAQILERGLMLLLLEVENLADFVESLIDEGQVTPGIAQAIVQDLGEQVLGPLQGFTAVGSPTPSAKAPAARTQPPPQVQMPIYSAPPLQSPRYVRADEEAVAFKAAPLPPKMAMPAQNTAAAPSAAVAAAPVAAKAPEVKAQPRAAIAEHSVMDPKMESLPVGEVEQKVAPQPVVPAPVAMPSVPVPPPVPAEPSPAPAEPKLRLADPATAVPEQRAFVTPPVPVRPPSADDPYREPVDLT